MNNAMSDLTIDELEAMAGIPSDVIYQGIAIGLYNDGWITSREPLRFHPKTAILIARTCPLLDRVERGELTLQKFHDVLWTVAQAGPDRLVEYLAPPSNRAVQAMLAGRSIRTTK
jgi:hypothetical protein